MRCVRQPSDEYQLGRTLELRVSFFRSKRGAGERRETNIDLKCKARVEVAMNPNCVDWHQVTPLYGTEGDTLSLAVSHGDCCHSSKVVGDDQ